MQARTVVPADESRMATLLAEAFVADPFARWMYPHDATYRDRFADLTGRLLRLTRPVHRVLRTDDDGACAIWVRPGEQVLSLGAQARLVPTVPGLGRRAVPVLRALEHADRNHPREPHWYLFLVGSDPARRGLGHGRAVIEPVLDECDRDRLPAYLESSNPDNVGYYERFGFRVTGELTRAGSPPLIPMWRQPRDG